MATGRIVLLSGAPGTGKSTAAALLARDSQLEASLTLRTDSFYEALGKGAVPPHLPGSETQNQVVIEAFLAAAECFAQGGYDVIVDGVVGPWYLAPWLAAARKGTEIHYFVLRADRGDHPGPGPGPRQAGRGHQPPAGGGHVGAVRPPGPLGALRPGHHLPLPPGDRRPAPGEIAAGLHRLGAG